MLLSVVSLIPSSTGYIWSMKLLNSDLFMHKTSSMYLYVKFNWDANCFFPSRAKSVCNSALIEERKMSARRKAQFVPIAMQGKDIQFICCYRRHQLQRCWNHDRSRTNGLHWETLCTQLLHTLIADLLLLAASISEMLNPWQTVSIGTYYVPSNCTHTEYLSVVIGCVYHRDALIICRSMPNGLHRREGDRMYQAPCLYEAKSRKYQGVFEVKSRVKTWQVRGIWSQQLEH